LERARGNQRTPWGSEKGKGVLDGTRRAKGPQAKGGGEKKPKLREQGRVR